MISLISSLEIINVFLFAKSEGRVPDPKIFLGIAASVADAAAVNPNGIKTLLASGFNRFFIKGNPFYTIDPKHLPKGLPECPIFGN